MTVVAGRWLAALALALLPAAAGAQSPVAALPSDTACPVALPGDGWTEAENFAWRRICLGKQADMRAAGSGGRLDGEACAPAEIEAAGRDVPVSRLLSPAFLDLVLARAPWRDARSSATVRITCAEVDGDVSLAGLEIPGDVQIRTSRLAGDLDLVQTRFTRTFSLGGSTIFGKIDGEAMRTGHDLDLNDTVIGELHLLAARIGWDVSLQRARILGPLNMSRARVDGGVYLANARFARFAMGGARVEEQVVALNARFDGALVAHSLTVGESFLLRGGARVGELYMPAARIGGYLQLAGSSFDGRVNLTRLHAGELVLFRPGTAEEHSQATGDDPAWGSMAELVLTDARVGALQARPESWRGQDGWIPADLTDFSYSQLGGFRADREATMENASGADLIDWLEGVRPKEKSSRYEPSTYDQLAAALRREGMEAKAREVVYAKYARRSAVPPPGTSWLDAHVFWPLSDVLVGYGVYPFRLIGWFAGLVALGWGLCALSRDRVHLLGPADWLWYSLENALPLIPLSERHRYIDHGRRWLDGFYHVQKLAGFVLATYLVGALTLLSRI